MLNQNQEQQKKQEKALEFIKKVQHYLIGKNLNTLEDDGIKLHILSKIADDNESVTFTINSTAVVPSETFLRFDRLRANEDVTSHQDQQIKSFRVNSDKFDSVLKYLSL
jgi:hypothetical protein